MKGFLRLFPTRALSRVAAKYNPVTGVVSSVAYVLKEGTAYLRVLEKEDTRRESIEADRQFCVERIQAQRDILTTRLGHDLEERKRIVDAGFQGLELGLESGDPELIRKALEEISHQIEYNPVESMRNPQSKNSKGA